MQNKLSHINPQGETNMVDISGKTNSKRYSIASGFVSMTKNTLNIALKENNPKGSIIETAKIAAILAAKRTFELIPLTHSIHLENISIDIVAQDKPSGFLITAKTFANAKTGAEIEALYAVTTAAVTIYDMLKAVEKSIKITDVRVLEKYGGKSGNFKAHIK